MAVLKTDFSPDFSEFVSSHCTARYEPGGVGEHGFDCWGLVEIWFKYWFDVTLIERIPGQSKPADMLRQYHRFRESCFRLDKPENHCLIIMYDEKSRIPREGHCGIYYNSTVLHMERGLGLCSNSFQAPSIQRRLAGIFRHPATMER